MLREASATAARRALSAWPRWSSLSGTESSAGRAAASEDKDAEEGTDKGAGTLQSKAAANAFKLAKEVIGGPGTLLSRLKALRRENADDDLWSLLRSLDPNAADLADPGRLVGVPAQRGPHAR